MYILIWKYHFIPISSLYLLYEPVYNIFRITEHTRTRFSIISKSPRQTASRFGCLARSALVGPFGKKGHQLGNEKKHIKTCGFFG